MSKFQIVAKPAAANSCRWRAAETNTSAIRCLAKRRRCGRAPEQGVHAGARLVAQAHARCHERQAVHRVGGLFAFDDFLHQLYPRRGVHLTAVDLDDELESRALEQGLAELRVRYEVRTIEGCRASEDRSAGLGAWQVRRKS